jgi:secondary thiamine-phosphate synthase enzyme
MKTFEIQTHDRDEMLLITDTVAAYLEQTKVAQGTVTVWVPHTTAAVTINENADPDVVHDILAALDRAVPWQQPSFRHNEGNSAAHLKSSLVGCSVTIPFRDHKMILGTWQGIFFCEFDGPRRRQFTVTVTAGS